VPRRSRHCTWQPATSPAPRRAHECVRRELPKRIVQRYYDEVLTSRRMDVLHQLVAPEFVGHDPVGATMDRAGYIDSVRMWHAGFAHLIVRIEDQVAERDRVTTRWTATAKHTGQFAGIAPTWRDVRISGTDIHRLEGGRLVEMWEQLDFASLLAQML
jgi:predicted ester cyclase